MQKPSKMKQSKDAKPAQAKDAKAAQAKTQAGQKKRKETWCQNNISEKAKLK